MLCRNPYLKGMHMYPCGQCMPCRFNRRRVWTHRIMLEALQKTDNAFFSLTYSDQNLPLNSDLQPVLIPKDLQDWLKRFRKAIQPLRVRYFGVGEYGDETFRPHFHVIIFGYPMCLRGRTKLPLGDRPFNCCHICNLVHSTWGKGLVYGGDVTTESAQYCSGYTVKKMGSKDDPRLAGRHPEFARMSLRPGIGADALHDVASALLQFNLEESQGDVPSALRHGGRLLPLGRYLRMKLRHLVGKDEKAPESTLLELQELLRPMREDSGYGTSPGPLAAAKFKNAVIEAADQKVASMEARNRIFKKRGTI